MQQIVEILCMADRTVSSGNRVRKRVQTPEVGFGMWRTVYGQRGTVVLSGVQIDQSFLLLLQTYNLLSQVLVVDVGKFQFTFQFLAQLVEPQFILSVIADFFFGGSSESADFVQVFFEGFNEGVFFLDFFFQSLVVVFEFFPEEGELVVRVEQG
jgi:hypothetical protein